MLCIFSKKEIGDVENWSERIEADMRTVAYALEYAHNGIPPESPAPSTSTNAARLGSSLNSGIAVPAGARGGEGDGASGAGGVDGEGGDAGAGAGAGAGADADAGVSVGASSTSS